MKRTLLFIAFVVLAVAVFQPTTGEAATELEKIRSEMARLKKDMEENERTKQQLTVQRQTVAEQKEQTAASINVIMEQIDTVSVEMASISERIGATEEELYTIGQALDETQARIEARDKLLRSRLRLMYTSGFVTYTDVLLSSNSFADFLDRFDSLRSILGQDREILEAHKADKALAEEQKKTSETKLAEVKSLYDKKENYYNLLIEKEAEKEVAILRYNEQMAELDLQTAELEDITEEQDAQLMKLARQEKAEIEKRNRQKNAVYYTGGKLGMPIKDHKRISSTFGPRVDPITGAKGRMHNGIDFAADAGTDIFAAESGTVIVAQATSGYGNTVIIDHGNGMWTLYGHIRSGGIKVEKGQTVKRGEKIAEVGSTGRSTGNHLHFEVRLNDKPVNPQSYLTS